MNMESQTPAGWYPDPWHQAELRYWDGAAWTGNVAVQTASAALRPTGRYNAENAARAAKFGRIAFILTAAQTAMFPLLLGIVAIVFGFAMDSLRTSSTTAAGTETSSGPPGVFIALWLVWIIGSLIITAIRFSSLGFLMAWTYRINENARDLAINTTFSSGLACCTWIIPLASIVMPYLAVRSCVPNDENRDRFLRWWLVFLLVPVGAALLSLSFVFLGVFLGPIGGIAGFVLCAAVGVLSGVVEYRIGIDVEKTIAQRHDEIAAGLPVQLPA